MAGMSSEEWDDLAAEQLFALVQREHAVVKAEAEAKLSEANTDNADLPLPNPHHLTNARSSLINSGALVEHTGITKGGRSIPVLQLASPRKGTKTAVAAAVRRKRAIYTRYLSWAMGNAEYPHGRIGPGTERVVRTSIMAAGSLRAIAPDAGEVSRLLGVDLAGPLDSGGILATGAFDNPGDLIAVAIEIKSLREWTYPTTQELYQLLTKAALIQQRTTSTHPVLPVLVCRKAHYTGFRMAKQLGFFILEMKGHYTSSASIKTGHVAEVRAELGFIDLIDTGDEDTKVIKQFRHTIPERAGLPLAETWRETCHTTNISNYFTTLKDNTLPPSRRAQEMTSLRSTCARAGRHDGW